VAGILKCISVSKLKKLDLCVCVFVHARNFHVKGRKMRETLPVEERMATTVTAMTMILQRAEETVCAISDLSVDLRAEENGNGMNCLLIPA
jgi:hypothetical protein